MLNLFINVFVLFKKARPIPSQQPTRVSNRGLICFYVEKHNPRPIALGYVQWLIEIVRRGKMAKLFDNYNETDAGEFCRIEIDPLPEVGQDLRGNVCHIHRSLTLNYMAKQKRCNRVIIG